ncbi:MULTISPECIES: hypothetical protein [unclassified Caballeronia]|uniref:hypothetical protein n=1 Tax=unclassified Caballeronia TaxID=2646786 RepID=UPI00285989E5|nr:MULTISPECIES: hypothetical protein [unclassified Caballeronia]MDR5776992.1 hypothetical protein [Caballeronia sp. LZ002]MDR5852433.1 hypothetical protein [Caballeronia sp. LZ003]
MDTDQQSPTPATEKALARYNGRYSKTKRGYVVEVIEHRDGDRVLVEGIGLDGWRRRFLVKSENLQPLCELF